MAHHMLCTLRCMRSTHLRGEAGLENSMASGAAHPSPLTLLILKPELFSCKAIVNSFPYGWHSAVLQSPQAWP